jgi:RHS repeat-associated protein
MISRNTKLLAAASFCAGLLALFLGLLQMALPALLSGLALLLGLATWGLTRQQMKTSLRAAVCATKQSPPMNRRGYRLLSALVIAGLLTGMIPSPTPSRAAPAPQPAAAPQAQAAADSQPSGKGQIIMDGPFGVQVNTYNGNLFYRRADLRLSCPLALEIALSYNSLHRETVSPLGFFGWQFAYDISYREYQVVETHYQLICASGVGCSWSPYQVVRDFIAIKWAEGGESHYEVGRDAFSTPGGRRDTLTRPQPGKYLLTTWHGYKYYFDSIRHRRITRIEDPNGLALVFTYDEVGLLTRVGDSYGRRLELAYALDGGVYYLSQVTDSNVTPTRLVQYGHDASGNLTSITDPLGNTTLYSYDTHDLTHITDPQGNRLDIAYDADGRAISLLTPLSALYFSYGATQNTVMEIVEGQVRRAIYAYDGLGRVIQASDGAGRTIGYAWDGDDNLTRLTNPNGGSTTLAYDSRGNLIAVTDPLGQTERYGYVVGVSQPVSFTDKLGNITYYEYDSRNNLTRITDPLGNRTAYTYDAAGRTTSFTDLAGRATGYEYDAYGNLIRITDHLSRTTTYTYDAVGNRLTETDPAGNVTRYTYDAVDRIVSITDPLSRTTRFAYNAAGKATTSTDPAGRTTHYEYDGLNRPVAVIDPLGGRIRLAYDGANNLIRLTDPLERNFSLAYNDSDYLIREADPLGNATTYERDAMGNIIRRVDANGRATAVSLNGLSQVTQANYPDGNPVSYAYDAEGHQIGMTNTHASLLYTYDAAGRLTGVTTHIFALGVSKTVSYAYGNDGALLSMTDPDGGVTTYTYDAAARLATITNPAGQTTTFAYDTLNRLTRKTLGNGAYAEYTYDAVGQLLALVHRKADGSVLASFAYTCDAAGNRASVSDAGGTTSYVYDALDRLTGVTYPDGVTAHYTYDAAGNRLTLAQSGAGATAYAYNAGDQLTQALPPAGAPITYTYDANGNLAQQVQAGQVVTFAYDARNRFTAVGAAGDGVTRFTRYPDSRLLSRTAPDGATTYYVYNQDNVLQELDGSGAVLARYTSGEVDEWLSQQRGGVTTFYHADALGSVIGLSDLSGNLAATYAYDPFGNSRGETGSVVNSYRFTGRADLGIAGVYDYRARLYSPALGRFLSKDPITARTDPNPYLYVGNSPLSRTDPLGLLLWQKKRPPEDNDVWAGFGGFAAFQVGAGARIWSGAVINTRTGESCTISVSCLKLGGTVDIGVGISAISFTGAANGQDLAGVMYGIYLGFGANVGPVGGSIGGEYYPQSDDALSEAAAGVGAGVNIIGGGQRCKTTVHSCARQGQLTCQTYRMGSGRLLGSDYANVVEIMERSCRQLQQLSRRDGRPPPQRPRNPSDPRPPDDTFSVATRELAAPMPIYRGAPLVALLENGFAAEAGDYLNYIGQPYVLVDVNFRPDMAFPVLFIPSGGLFGLSSSALFKAKLEEYVRNGGVIVALDQQSGRDFRLLPGGQLDGHGWNEGLQCFRSAYYIENYHQILSGFDRFYVDTPVDGEFTEYPDGATVLLTRSRNAWPGLIMYPYPPSDSPPAGGAGGGGWVIAATIYADWARWNWQASADTRILLRDLIAWAVEPQDLPEHDPGATFTLPVTLINNTNTDAAAARLSILTPDKAVVTTTLTTINIPSGAQAATDLTIRLADYPTNLGIWWVDYTLLDAHGSVIQREAAGARFVVSNPSPAADPDRDLKLWVETPGHYYVRGMDATFRVQVRNDGAAGHTVSLRYPCGNPSFTVNPGVTTTLPCTQTIWGSGPFDAQLYEGGALVGRAGTAILVVAPVVDVIPASEKPRYRAGETATITTTLRNLQRAPFDLTNFMRIRDPEGALVYSSTFTTTLPGSATQHITRTPTLPSTLWGLYEVRVESFREAVPLGVGVSHFEMPGPRFVITPTRPGPYLPGITNTVTFSVTNAGYDHANGATLAAVLRDPDGVQLWSGSQDFDLPAGQTAALSFAIPFTARVGVYRLEHHAWQSNYEVRGVTELPAAHAVEFLLDKSSYSGGDAMNVNLLLKNTGVFSEILGSELVIPALAYTSTRSVPIGPGEQLTLPHTASVPLDIRGGTYPIRLTLSLGADQDRRDSYFVVLPADLDPRLVPADHAAGGPLRLTVRNRGGGRTAYTCQASLHDTEGRLVLGHTYSNTVILPGEVQTTTLTIPTGVRDSMYYLRNECIAADTGRVTVLARLFPVGGVQARLEVMTDDDLYLTGQPVTVTGVITNIGSYNIVSGTLELAVISAEETGRLSGAVYDLYSGQPVAGARVELDSGAWVHTSLSGHFAFAGMAAREYTVTVYRAGYQVYQAQHTLGPETTVDIHLTPTIQAELNGLVRVGTQITRVVGADLTLTPITVTGTEVRPLHVRSRFDGYYIFPAAPAGTYTLTVSAPGFPLFERALTLPGGSCTQNIPLGTTNALPPCPILLSQAGPGNRQR